MSNLFNQRREGYLGNTIKEYRNRKSRKGKGRKEGIEGGE